MDSAPRRTPRRARFFWPAVVATIVLDLLTKLWAERALLPEHLPHRIIGDWLRFTLTHNLGAAMGMHVGRASRALFGALSLGAIWLLSRFYRATRREDGLRALAIGLLLGGAAGNLIDRVRSGRGVVDFIDVGAGDMRFWTFNLADIAVTCGALLLAFVMWGDDRRRAGQRERAVRR